ncbi:MAG TPA: sigma-70 family RNA polymerase sigma factor, partial [Polyangiales bacterium]
RHEADADDVVQDTLLAVATHLAEFQGRSSLSSWVFMLARTACARRRRGLKNRPHVSEDAVSERASEDSPEASAEERELRRALERALANLSEEQREVLLLRDMEGLTAPEVADSLGIGVEAVKSRLHRARSALREALQTVLEGRAPARETSCPDIVAAFSQKLEGELGAEDCAAMERHMQACPACASACAALRSALWACRTTAPRQAVPASIQARVKGALRAFTGAR